MITEQVAGRGFVPSQHAHPLGTCPTPVLGDPSVVAKNDAIDTDAIDTDGLFLLVVFLV